MDYWWNVCWPKSSALMNSSLSSAAAYTSARVSSTQRGVGAGVASSTRILFSILAPSSLQDVFEPCDLYASGGAARNCFLLRVPGFGSFQGLAKHGWMSASTSSPSYKGSGSTSPSRSASCLG